jgi:hypothetical protein
LGGLSAGGRSGTWEGDSSVDMTEVQCTHVWKYHNEIHYFTQLIYAN